MKRTRALPMTVFTTLSAALVLLATVPNTGHASAQNQATATPAGESTQIAPAAATSAATIAACTDLLQTAIAATDKRCADTGRNQLCYGNTSLKAELQAGATNISFDQPGQIVPIGSGRKLQLSSLDTQIQTWGVALLQVQANFPDT